MRYRKVEYSVEQSSQYDDIWDWRFEIGNAVRAGKTRTRIKLLAIRRVEMLIDRFLHDQGDRPAGAD
jgi:hypothetical protein